MSICDKNREILADFVAGLGSLEEFDDQHARSCASCRKEYAEARRLRSFLEVYRADSDRDAERYLQRSPIVLPRQRTPRFGRIFRWGALAASLLLVFMIARRYPAQPEPNLLMRDYIVALGSESARTEILEYVNRTQLLLLALMEDDDDCADEHLAKRALARRLIFQKKLLEPGLSSREYSDVKPLLDDMDLLFLNVAEGEGCFKKEEVDLWKKVIESKSALMKLHLLQERDRI
jgi:hypothetical protein